MPSWKNNFLLILLRAFIRAFVASGTLLVQAGRWARDAVRASPRLTASLKTILIYGYDQVRQLRKAALSLHPRGRLRVLIAHPHTLRATLMGIILVVLITNLHTRTRAAEDLGRESLLYRIVTADAHAIVVDTAPAVARLGRRGAGEIIRREQSLPEEPVNDYPYALALGSGAILRPNPSETLRGSRPRDGVVTYIVQANDTVSGIAYRFTLSINTLLWANNLRASSLIRPGDSLAIPPQDGVIHTVKKGETLSSIAQRYRADAQKIRTANNLADATALTPGLSLMVPEGRPPSLPAAPRPATVVARPAGGAEGRRVAGSGFIWPTAGHSITQYFSWRHSGLDIDGNLSSPIIAAEDGVVETAQGGWNGGYGIVIVIERGQTIGVMGSTGRSTGSHLHFEVLINGARKNPLSYL
jgi:LysM repeat protein